MTKRQRQIKAWLIQRGIGLALILTTILLVVVALKVRCATEISMPFLFMMGIASFFTGPIGLVMLFSRERIVK